MLIGGVVNILTGGHDHMAKYLAEHQDIESVWYFGTDVGSKFVEYASAENVKRTWVNYGLARNWFDDRQGQGEEFLYQSTEAKNVHLTMGDIFANWKESIFETLIKFMENIKKFLNFLAT